MNQNAINKKLLDSLTIMGISYPFMYHIKQCRSIADLNKCVATMKTQVGNKRRELAKKYHPDICGDDKKMKAINDAADFLNKLKIQVVPPRPQPVYVYSYTYHATDTTNTSWTTSSWR